MKLFLLLVSLAVANAGVPFEPIELDYHNKVGIPLAERIRQAEMAQDFDGGRIIGGSPSNVGNHPHLGGLVVTLTDGRQSTCGSSLITNTRLVTAAHCWATRAIQGRSLVVVFASTTLFSGGTRVTSSNVQMHANYNMDNLNNDVAIIIIPWLNYNNNIRNIALASGTNAFVGVNAVAAGYGLTADSGGSSGQLRHVTLQVISNADCARVYGTNNIIASTICTSSASDRNVCRGDSGGSLIAGGQLIGITSFVAQRGCQAGMPAGFARVTSFNAWIQARL
ncbi:unnamed protein product, partial [Brenthis ino]